MNSGYISISAVSINIHIFFYGPKGGSESKKVEGSLATIFWTPCHLCRGPEASNCDDWMAVPTCCPRNLTRIPICEPWCWYIKTYKTGWFWTAGQMLGFIFQRHGAMVRIWDIQWKIPLSAVLGPDIPSLNQGLGAATAGSDRANYVSYYI